MTASVAVRPGMAPKMMPKMVPPVMRAKETGSKTPINALNEIGHKGSFDVAGRRAAVRTSHVVGR